MRQRVGEKKLKQLEKKTGLELAGALVRGGTDHRIDLCLTDGTVRYLFTDGSIEDTDMNHDIVRDK